MPKRTEAMIVEETQRVLTVLQENANEDISVIAKRCHMSKDKLVKTIRHLERNQKIWGYTAVVDEHCLPLKKFVLLFKRNAEKFDGSLLSKNALEKFKAEYEPLGVRIDSSYFIYGEYDWLVIFNAQDLAAAKKFNVILFDHFPGLTEKASLMEVLLTHRAHYIVNPDQSKLREIV